VLSGNGGTAFTAHGVSAERNLNVVTAADFNRDGWMDAAAASRAANRVVIYLGGVAGLRFSQSYVTGLSPRCIVAADVNHDGMIDVVTANRSNGTVSVLLGRRSAPGTFTEARDFAAGPGSRAVVAGDFNRDGRLDLATGNQNRTLRAFSGTKPRSIRSVSHLAARGLERFRTRRAAGMKHGQRISTRTADSTSLSRRIW
jgi:FG-GAP-like repeat